MNKESATEKIRSWGPLVTIILFCVTMYGSLMNWKGVISTAVAENTNFRHTIREEFRVELKDLKHQIFVELRRLLRAENDLERN